MYMCFRRGLDVDEVMVDAAADWKPVDKPPEAKDDDGNTCTCVFM